MPVARELLTDRLVLRQWREDDVEPLAAIYAQPAFLEHMPLLDLEETRAQVERYRRAWEEDGFSHWAVEETAGVGRLIGRIGLMRHRDWPLGGDPVEVGWSLDPSVWGRGLATEGGLASLEQWRSGLTGEARLISITAPANVRSRRVMEKLGLSYGGTAFWHGYDVVWFSLAR